MASQWQNQNPTTGLFGCKAYDLSPYHTIMLDGSSGRNLLRTRGSKSSKVSFHPAHRPPRLPGKEVWLELGTVRWDCRLYKDRVSGAQPEIKSVQVLDFLVHQPCLARGRVLPE